MGSVYRYRGVKDGEPSREVMTVTHRTRTIDGARCVVVSDLLYLRGKLEERTRDYYTQDADGNVWYFGEDTAELDANGQVKTREGTWHAGVDGAKPGIFMYAHPRVGQSAKQEYLKARPRITSQVLRRGVSMTVPFKAFRRTLLTKEWTPRRAGRARPQVLRPRDRHGARADGQGRQRAQRARFLHSRLSEGLPVA